MQSVEERIDSLVTRQMRTRKIPGLSLAVVRNGRLEYTKGYGEANLEWKTPSTPETVYLLASMTKQFTATAIMMLVNEGRVALDDRLQKFIANAPAAWSDITVRHLLTHTAGLRDRFELSDDGRMYMDYNTAQMLGAAMRTPVDFAPGARFSYSDQGYFLLGVIIEKVSGKTYDQFLRERIFAPAGMTSTSIHDWAAIVPQRADGYALAGDMLVGSRRRYQFSVTSHYGVQSSVRDLAKYDSALAAGAIVPLKTLAEMWTPARVTGGGFADFAGIGYGYGWFLEKFNGHRLVYHAGSTGTCIYRLPDDGIDVIVLTNLEQISGSDPCMIARGVATRYVPDAAIVDAPVRAETDPVRGARLRMILERFARGETDTADFTTEALAVLGPAAKAQGPSFAQLGALGTLQLVADDSLAARVVHYRATYAKAVVNFRFVLDVRGRIASMQAR